LNVLHSFYLRSLMNYRNSWLRIDYVLFAVVSAALICQFFWLIDLPFFWDAKSKALRANWIYSQEFSSLIVPTELNSGHPPLWIGSMALVWTILGKSLWAARLLLLLVNIGVVYQLYALFLRLRTPQVPKLIFLLLCVEPTFLAQTTSLNNDILLLLFVLFSLNSLLSNQWKWFALALTGLLLTNLRGLYFTLAIIIIHVWLYRSELLNTGRKMIFSYGVALVAFLAFVTLQYTELGWAIVSQNKGFSQHRKPADLSLVLKNFLLYGKSFLEFGRFAVWIPLFFFLPKLLRKGNRLLHDRSRMSLYILIVICALLFIGSVPFSNPISPRYFMSCYLLLIILTANLIFQQTFTSVVKKGIIAFIAVSFLSGHFWIYPPKLSQAWDSSLAYLNYYEPEQKMFNYIEEQGIQQSDIGSHLPLVNYHLELSDVPDISYEFVNVDFQTNQYILFSNVENASTDTEIEVLQTQWKVVVSYSKKGVFLTLYQRPQ